METAGDEFLSATVRTRDEDSGVGRGDLVDHLADVADRLGLAYHLLAIDFLLEDLVVLDKIGLVRSVLYGDEDPVEVERLLDEVECAFLDALDGGVDVPVAGDHDYSGIYALSDKFLKDLGAFHARHLDVAEYYVVSFLRGNFEGGRTVLRYFYGKTFIHQYFLERVPDCSLVIDNKYLHL